MQDLVIRPLFGSFRIRRWDLRRGAGCPRPKTLYGRGGTVLVTVTPRLRVHRDEVILAYLKGNTVHLRFVSMKPIRVPVDELTAEARPGGVSRPDEDRTGAPRGFGSGARCFP